MTISYHQQVDLFDVLISADYECVIGVIEVDVDIVVIVATVTCDLVMECKREVA